MKSRPITNADRADRRAAMAAAVADGFDLGMVAKSHKCSIQTVRMACREHGIEVAHRPAGSVGIRTLKVLALLLRNMSRAEVAKKLGMHISGVARVARAAKAAGITLAKETE